MKAAPSNDNRLEIIGPAYPLGPEFVHCAANACLIGQDESGVYLLTDDRIQNNRLKERDTQRVSREEQTRPIIRSKQVRTAKSAIGSLSPKLFERGSLS